MSGVDALGVALAALLPVALLSLTSFVKVSVVLGLFRNALGTPESPSSLVVMGISLVLTGVTMAPVARDMAAAGAAAQAPAPRAATQATTTSEPWQALLPAERRAQLSVVAAAIEPLAKFCARNAGAKELETFAAIGGSSRDALVVVGPAFIASELREAFTMAVLLLLPFLVIDLVVSLSLAALGLGAMSPQAVALPLKLLLFLTMDGWRLLLAALLRGYA